MTRKTRISRHGLLWHFQHIVDNARDQLRHSEFQLKGSVDMDGTSHRADVDTIIKEMQQHLNAMKAFLQEQQDEHQNTR